MNAEFTSHSIIKSCGNNLVYIGISSSSSSRSPRLSSNSDSSLGNEGYRFL